MRSFGRNDIAMDATSKALIETIGNVGYIVVLSVDDAGRHIIEATDDQAGECFVVRGDDLYTVAVEVAEQANRTRGQRTSPDYLPWTAIPRDHARSGNLSPPIYCRQGSLIIPNVAQVVAIEPSPSFNEV